jgi:hypothetical protein
LVSVGSDAIGIEMICSILGSFFEITVISIWWSTQNHPFLIVPLEDSIFDSLAIDIWNVDVIGSIRFFYCGLMDSWRGEIGNSFLYMLLKLGKKRCMRWAGEAGWL